MSAWFIITTKVHDKVAFTARYSPALAEVTEKFGGRTLVRGGRGMVLEGEGYEGGGAVVIEWPDAETALRFWNSPEYGEVKKLREGIADVSVLLIED